MSSISTFTSSLGYNLGGQFLARVVSFFANIYLLRKVNGDLLGIVNVRLTLYYTTILFLVREPFRKACLGTERTSQRFINLLCPVLACVLSVLLAGLWLRIETPSASILPDYSSALRAFAFSAIIEALAEPFWIISQRLELVGHVAFAQSLLVFLQRVLVVVLLYTSNLQSADCFCYAQILASSIYLVIHVGRFALFYMRHDYVSHDFQNWTSFLPRPWMGLEMGQARLVGSFLMHSILKQLLTDSAGYVMTFTNVLSLTQQAVYDAIDRLGSLAARIVLAPVEEASYVYFSTNMPRKYSSVVDEDEERKGNVKRVFIGLLHFTTMVGSVICVFGPPYSKLAVLLYGGSLLGQNSGALLLSLYCVYMLVLAINGITECFAMATMSDSQILKHGRFLLVTAVCHLGFHLVLSWEFAASGFIMANTISMIIRIAYSLRHIESQQRGWGKTAFISLLPSFSLAMLLILSFIVTGLSYLIFGAQSGIIHPLAHVAVGMVMLILVGVHIWQSDVVLADFVYHHLPFLRQRSRQE